MAALPIDLCVPFHNSQFAWWSNVRCTDVKKHSSASGHRSIIHRWSHTFCNVIIHMDLQLLFICLNQSIGYASVWSTHSSPHFDIIYIRGEIILNAYLHVNRHHRAPYLGRLTLPIDPDRSSFFWSRAQANDDDDDDDYFSGTRLTAAAAIK